jgi:fumarylacetoacetate (FAA) hydrolase
VEKKGQRSWPQGYSCIAEKRAMEILQDGQAVTSYLRFGDTIRIEMKNAAGQSVFGAIEQEVQPPQGQKPQPD